MYRRTMRLQFVSVIRIDYGRNIAPIAIFARHGGGIFFGDL